MTDTLARITTALEGRYRVSRELGAGGMATVYRAHDIKHERDVAIKVLPPDLGAALGGERFLSEIRTTARLQHPHILPLFDSGEADGLLYYVMPLVTGETLRARLERDRQRPVADAVLIARRVRHFNRGGSTIGRAHRAIADLASASWRAAACLRSRSGTVSAAGTSGRTFGTGGGRTRRGPIHRAGRRAAPAERPRA
jgi:eukaryotic-like serine/threonine-protein kinase